MNKLIIAEKPSVAVRLASSLAEGNYKRLFFNGISYYELKNKEDTVYVVAAAGHLFTIRQKEGSKGFPVFDVEWVPSYKVNKNAYFTKKYLDTIAEIGKKCNIFINACDYDIEGSVIGTNIIKFVMNGDVNTDIEKGFAKRMKFSTTTNEDLIKSYNETGSFDEYNFDAGETRHMLDWMWGINLSRALMGSLYINGVKKIVSIGRVQGPTLAILAKREEEIKAFVSRPYWKVFVTAKGIDFENAKEDIPDKKTADEILEKSRRKEAVVEKVERKEIYERPLPPFDLTSLQVEANRVFGIDPSRTLAIAQILYERAYISYPRTSSQKLPYTLNLPRIIEELGKNEKYAELAKALIKERRFKPAEGAKEDEAHPAIFPTGIAPKSLEEEENKIYDLIVKRFITCFADYATLEKTSVKLSIEDEKYYANGEVIKKTGWISFYAPYFTAKDKPMPNFDEGEVVKIEKIFEKELKTMPPKRYTKASLISLLERKNLGTKATRAEVIDTLFKRNYVVGSSLKVTDFGMSIYNALKENCNEILNEALTRKLEEDMENIMHGKANKKEVIEEGKKIIEDIIKEFKANEEAIGKGLVKGLEDTAKGEVLGKCKCGGELVIKRSKKGKNFVGCTRWPECSVTYPLPQAAKIVPTNKVCQYCHTPIVKVFRKGKRVFEMCLEPTCPSKKDWNKNVEKAEKTEKAKKTARQKKAKKGA
ncbi:MAG: DNA topoisomerase I [Candidatus Micrarchaeia archaeon]